MSKNVLMVAYHFPPMKGSSGIQRTLKFCEYLPQFGWQPTVLSVHERAYAATSPDQTSHNVAVRRVFALDAARHLAIHGRYPKLLAIPDRWASRFFAGVSSGLRLIHTLKPKILWSTYPIATAHLIGYALHKLTGLPWVADLRDPMAQEDYPEDPLQWKAFRWIEEKIARHASAICFTSPGALEDFMRQHPDTAHPGKLHLLENGYDEECFADAEKLAKLMPRKPGEPPTLLHSGVVYPSERDPRPFFQAVSKLAREGRIDPSSLRIVFRASGHEAYLAPQIQALGLGGLIKLAPPIPYVEALAEMLAADALMVLQAPNCNHQIPAKAYEYLRAGRPILGLTDAEGDTGRLLGNFPGNILADIRSSEDIANKLCLLLERLASEHTPAPSPPGCHSRRAKTRQLAYLFDSLNA